MNAETVNGTHYQSVSCSAVDGRPPPQISWLVNGLHPSHPAFTTKVSDAVFSNGTSTLSSVLRFPTHLQDDESVTCVVQHPTLPNPKLTTVKVETYGKRMFSGYSDVIAVAALPGGDILRCITSQTFAIMHHDSASYNTITFSCIFFFFFTHAAPSHSAPHAQ